MIPVAAELEERVPAEFEAVTRERIRLPTSAETSAYVWLVALDREGCVLRPAVGRKPLFHSNERTERQ